MEHVCFESSIHPLFHTVMAHIYDKNGEVLSEETEVIGRWKEHLEVPLEDDLEIMKEEVI